MGFPAYFFHPEKSPTIGRRFNNPDELSAAGSGWQEEQCLAVKPSGAEAVEFPVKPVEAPIRAHSVAPAPQPKKGK